jgi:hypothetical protein
MDLTIEAVIWRLPLADLDQGHYFDTPAAGRREGAA